MDRLLDILTSPFNLRFLDDDEKAFRIEQNQEMNRNLRICLLGLLVSFVAFYLITDKTFYPANTLNVMFPLVFLGLLATVFPGDARHSQLLNAGFSATVQLLIFWFTVKHSLNTEKVPTYNFIVPCILGHFVVLRLLFIPAVISGAIVFAGIILMTQAIIPAEMSKIFYIAFVCYILGLVVCQRQEVMRRDNFMSLRSIEKERKTTKSLIDRMIPKELTDRIMSLQNGNIGTIHDEIELGSFLFVELSPTTDKSTKRHLFRIFDSILNRSKSEKIKTVENCYIAAGGLFQGGNCTEEVLNIAIRFRHEMVQFNLDNNSNISMRAAITSGPASSGVIGQRTFAFDVWGKPVNLASRILTTAPWGSICLCAETVNQLPPGYDCLSLGTRSFKGTGDQELFEYRFLSYDSRFKAGCAA